MMNLARATAAFRKHFPTDADLCKVLGFIPEKMEKFPVVVKYQPVPTGGYQIMLQFSNYSNVMYFTLAPYPSCCGIYMFHSFVCNDKLPQAFVDEFMDAFFAENQAWLGSSKRLEVIMVESRHDTPRTPDGGFDMLVDLEPVENPQITYKKFWTYFHTKARKVRTRLQLNNNTGNILHNMEVLF